MTSCERESLVITCSSHPSGGKGISTYSKLIAEEFSKKYNVFYLCPKNSRTTEWFDKFSIAPIFFDTQGDPLLEVSRIMKKINSIPNLKGVINNDVVHVQTLANYIQAPIISVVHLARMVIGKAALVNYQFTDHVVSISYDMYKEYRDKFPKDNLRLSMIPNGLPPSSFYKTDDVGRVRLVSGVEYSRRKGGDLLVALLNRLKKSTLDFDFCWIGSVPKRIKTSFHGDERFSFCEYLPREDYVELMSQANVYLFPSREEGCPMSLKEAMLGGLVPIAADGKGAMKQIIRHGIDGYLLGIKNWDQKSFSIIESLCNDPSLIYRMSKNSNSRINSEFSIKSTCTSLEFLLDNPTVEKTRNGKDELLKIYDWHRLPEGFSKTSIIDYINLIKFKFGVLTYRRVFESKLMLS